jgi:hypothetical protein
MVRPNLPLRLPSHKIYEIFETDIIGQRYFSLIMYPAVTTKVAKVIEFTLHVSIYLDQFHFERNIARYMPPCGMRSRNNCVEVTSHLEITALLVRISLSTQSPETFPGHPPLSEVLQKASSNLYFCNNALGDIFILANFFFFLRPSVFICTVKLKNVYYIRDDTPVCL